MKLITRVSLEADVDVVPSLHYEQHQQESHRYQTSSSTVAADSDEKQDGQRHCSPIYFNFIILFIFLKKDETTRKHRLSTPTNVSK